MVNPQFGLQMLQMLGPLCPIATNLHLKCFIWLSLSFRTAAIW